MSYLVTRALGNYSTSSYRSFQAVRKGQGFRVGRERVHTLTSTHSLNSCFPRLLRGSDVNRARAGPPVAPGLVWVKDRHPGGWNPGALCCRGGSCLAWVSPEEGQVLRRRAHIEIQDSFFMPQMHAEPLLCGTMATAGTRWRQNLLHKTPSQKIENKRLRDEHETTKDSTNGASFMQDGQGRTL